MADQSEIYKRINAQLKVTNSALRDQAVLHQSINVLLAEGIEAIEGSGARVNEMLKKQGVDVDKYSKSIISSNSKITSAITDNNSEIVGSQEGVFKAAIAYLKEAYAAGLEVSEAVLEMPENLKEGLVKASGDLTPAFLKIQRELGGNVLGQSRDFTNEMTRFQVEAV